MLWLVGLLNLHALVKFNISIVWCHVQRFLLGLRQLFVAVLVEREGVALLAFIRRRRKNAVVGELRHRQVSLDVAHHLGDLATKFLDIVRRHFLLLQSQLLLEVNHLELFFERISRLP